VRSALHGGEFTRCLRLATSLGGGILNLAIGFEPPVGSSFEILTNIGSAPITGTFNGLAEGATFTQDGYQLQINYQRGSGGNSVVLTRLT
jgi:hypothetical protein